MNKRIDLSNNSDEQSLQEYSLHYDIITCIVHNQNCTIYKNTLNQWNGNIKLNFVKSGYLFYDYSDYDNILDSLLLKDLNNIIISYLTYDNDATLNQIFEMLNLSIPDYTLKNNLKITLNNYVSRTECLNCNITCDAYQIPDLDDEWHICQKTIFYDLSKIKQISDIVVNAIYDENCNRDIKKITSDGWIIEKYADISSMNIRIKSIKDKLKCYHFSEIFKLMNSITSQLENVECSINVLEQIITKN